MDGLWCFLNIVGPANWLDWSEELILRSSLALLLHRADLTEAYPYIIQQYWEWFPARLYLSIQSNSVSQETIPKWSIEFSKKNFYLSDINSQKRLYERIEMFTGKTCFLYTIVKPPESSTNLPVPSGPLSKPQDFSRTVDLIDGKDYSVP